MPCNDTVITIFVPGIRVESPCLSGLEVPRQDRRSASACLLQRFPRLSPMSQPENLGDFHKRTFLV